MILYFLYLFWQYNTNRANFWRWAIYGILFLIFLFAIVIIVKKFRIRIKSDSMTRFMQKVREAGQEDYIINFINRFGFEGKKGKSWSFRNHFFDWDRINDLERFLIEKGIKLRTDEGSRDIFTVLKYYIQKKEESLTRESIKKEPQRFASLTGAEFEKLIYRLFIAKGYATEWIGKSGDQGGDLIANKDGDRVLIQTKCYRDWSTGNSAVQQVVGAMKLYNCNKAAVVTTSYFTQEAIELARANHTLLISKENLQEMLLKHLGESWG
jgi:HJR/Mrr/RecB family endonuclease